MRQKNDPPTVLPANVERPGPGGESYHLFFQRSPVPILVWDTESSRIVDINNRAEALFGFERKDFIGKPVEELVHPAERSRLAAYLERSPGELNRSGPWRLQPRDGRLVYAEATSSSIELDGHSMRLVHLSDVTDRIRAEAREDLTARLARTTGPAFFQELATRLAAISRAECVIVASFSGQLQTRARTIALWDSGRLAAETDIQLDGTPFASLLLEDVSVIRSGLPQRFPSFRWQGLDPVLGFVGVALRSTEGELLGFIANLHTSEIPDPRAEVEACQLYANRAAGELSRQAATENLKRSEERFKSLAQATTDAVWDYDLTTGVVWRSEAFTSLSGQSDSQQDSFPAGVHQRIHPDDRARVVESLSTAIERADTFWQDEYRFQRGDGTYASILDRATIMRDPSGRAVRIVGGMTDISERMEAATRLRQQAELLDRASDAIVVWDLENRIRYWNRGAQRLFGWEAKEVIGEDALTLFESSRSELSIATRQARENEEWSGEINKCDKLGRNHVLISRLTLIRGPAGEPRAILNIDTDITEKKQLEAQFLRAQRLESIGILAGGIAHDLNNMLTPITMSVDVLKRMHPEGDSARLLDSIEGCARRGADLVRQVLGFARGVEGKRLLVNPTFVAREIAKIVRDTFPKNIRVRVDCTRQPWLVTGDPTQLHQVLLNLCVNARDAMPEGGELQLTVANVTHTEALQGVLGPIEPRDYSALTVSDTGSGIPEEIRDKIFDPFFSTKPPGKGTGLGLSTLLAIVKSHGGALTMTTETGEGSSFCVLLPAERREGSKADQASVPRIQHGNGELLLIVDDEAYIRDISKQTLEAYGYEVIVASNGAEALSAFLEASSRVALVITDMMMPVMDGLALIRALRRINPTIPMIAASGLNADSMTDRARAAGASTFIAKPYTAEELLARIAELVHKER